MDRRCLSEEEFAQLLESGSGLKGLDYLKSGKKRRVERLFTALTIPFWGTIAGAVSLYAYRIHGKPVFYDIAENFPEEVLKAVKKETKKGVKSRKARSMELNAQGQEAYLMQGRTLGELDRYDSRIYSGMEKLRKSGLDEFPELWDVVRGWMALIGTRCPTIAEWDCFVKPGEDYHRLLTSGVRPGIIGAYWLMGGKGLDWEVRKRSEAFYGENATWLGDGRIFMRFLKMFVTRKAN